MEQVVLLNDILNNEENSLKKLKLNLKNRGWCFVKISEKFCKTVKTYSDEMKKFFSLEQNIKEKYSYNYNLGYYKTPSKQ